MRTLAATRRAWNWRERSITQKRRLSARTILHRLHSAEYTSDMSEEDFQHGGDRFPATRRSVIEAARSIDAEERERALEALCAAYWKPVYKYVRWRWNAAAHLA